jgi:hypothetical protein
MALVNCRECGHQVSSTAAACPSCGAKPKTPATYGLGSLFLFLILVGVLWRGASSDNPESVTGSTSEQTSSAPARSAAPDASQALVGTQTARAPNVRPLTPSSIGSAAETGATEEPASPARDIATPSTTIHFNQKTADEGANFNAIHSRVEVCMRSGALAMLRNGSRDAEQIVAFQVRACGGPLVQAIMASTNDPSCVNVVGGPCTPITQEAASAFVQAMAYEQLQLLSANGK